jgi:hypothetical protein
MWHVWEKKGFLTGFWCIDLRERNHFKDLGVNGRIILKWNFKERDGVACTGLVSTVNRWSALVSEIPTFSLHKMRINSFIA